MLARASRELMSSLLFHWTLWRLEVLSILAWRCSAVNGHTVVAVSELRCRVRSLVTCIIAACVSGRRRLIKQTWPLYCMACAKNGEVKNTSSSAIIAVTSHQNSVSTLVLARYLHGYLACLGSWEQVVEPGRTHWLLVGTCPRLAITSPCHWHRRSCRNLQGARRSPDVAPANFNMLQMKFAQHGMCRHVRHRQVVVLDSFWSNRRGAASRRTLVHYLE